MVFGLRSGLPQPFGFEIRGVVRCIPFLDQVRKLQCCLVACFVKRAWRSA